MSATDVLQKRFAAALMPNYGLPPVALARGEGCRVWDADGREYLDLFAGIAVNALGHANPILLAALKAQAEKLWHTSNIFTIPGQEKLAKALTDVTFADEVFFTNSGSEAADTALKIALAYHRARGEASRVRLIGRERGYHGVGFGGITVGGIGPNRKKALLHHFGSAKAVARAGLSDLESVPGINAGVAKKVYDHFHADE